MRSFNHNDMATLLNLQGLIIHQIFNKEDCYEVKIGNPGKDPPCPYCKTKKIKKHGFGKTRRIRHGVIISGLPLFLLYRSRRYYCNDCKRAFSKSPPKWLVTGKQRSSRCCRSQAIRTLKGTSFKETTRQTGLGYGVLRNILDDKITDNTLLQLPLDDEMTIGIDEHSKANRAFATTITLIKPERKLLAVLPVKTQASLEQWVLNNWLLEQRYRVTEVCVDMAKCWKYVVTSLFPNARIVIDHFHVISYLHKLIANEYRLSKSSMTKLDQINKLPYKTKDPGVVMKLREGGKYWTEKDRERIKTIFKLFPRVAELWYWKEEVRRIYRECYTKEEARQRWKIVLSHLDAVPRKTLSEQLENILNYFDKHSTNAFTEGVHTKFKLIKRYSYGLKNPKVYVKKLILGFVDNRMLIYSNTF
jgi:transposase